MGLTKKQEGFPLRGQECKLPRVNSDLKEKGITVVVRLQLWELMKRLSAMLDLAAGRGGCLTISCEFKVCSCLVHFQEN